MTPGDTTGSLPEPDRGDKIKNPDPPSEGRGPIDDLATITVAGEVSSVAGLDVVAKETEEATALNT